MHVGTPAELGDQVMEPRVDASGACRRRRCHQLIGAQVGVDERGDHRAGQVLGLGFFAHEVSLRSPAIEAPQRRQCGIDGGRLLSVGELRALLAQIACPAIQERRG
jgi:hypothetical protein